jgi:hypothetical protein
LPDFSCSKKPKRGKYTKLPQNIPNDRKIDQMVIKYTKIFHSKTSKIHPNGDFWFENKPSGNPDAHYEHFKFISVPFTM